MKNYKIILALCIAAFASVSCGQKARISCTVNGAPERMVVVKQLNGNAYDILDTVKTDAGGSFKYNVSVQKGQPEFIYLFFSDTKIASLLLESGEKAVVTTDTLGHYSVEGSEGSAKLKAVEQDFAKFISDVRNVLETSDNAQSEVSRLYVAYYRNCVKYLMNNPYSLTVVPVLFQKLNPSSPVFSQTTDAIHFRRACDSLKTVYPDSKYVKALEKETERREQVMSLGYQIDNAAIQGFPEIALPDINGERKSLSELKAKVILLHFWTSTNAEQKMFNIDVLKHIYDAYHSKGFEIYSVAVDADKAGWAQSVSGQNLPWINVNDGLGVASPVLGIYNVSELPTSFIIAGGEILGSSVKGEAGLRKELERLLK